MNNRLAHAVGAAVLLWLPLCQVGAAQPDPGHPDETGPRGLYLYPMVASLRNGDYEKARSVPGIDGVAVVVDWSELAPAGPDAYDFSALDRWIAAAASHHLAVELVIKAGKGVPSWIFEPAPSSAGASRLDFVYSHHSGVGPCTPVAMPPPWDPTYQSAFARMLGRVAAHLQETGAIRAVSVVKLTGMNT